MKSRFLLPLLLLGVLAAGCGGGGGGSAKLEPSDIAVVGSQHIPKSMFDEVMGDARHNLKVNHQTFPKAGSTAYANIKSQAVTLLVQEAEKENEAAKLGITITEKDIDARLKAIKKQYFANNETRYKQQLKKDELTEKEVRDQIKANLVAQKLFDKLTKDVSVTKAAIAAYYVQHQSDYVKPSSRAVQYILVGKKKSALANSIFSQLKSGGDWCKLAKKYSQDPSSSSNCGKATFSKGQTVAAFDKLLFSLPTGSVGKVETPEYGWFVLKPTGKATKASSTPVAVAGKQIQQTLLQNKKNELMNTWVSRIQKSYCSGSKIKYQPGFMPSPDPCAQTNNTTSTTG